MPMPEVNFCMKLLTAKNKAFRAAASVELPVFGDIGDHRLRSGCWVAMKSAIMIVLITEQNRQQGRVAIGRKPAEQAQHIGQGCQRHDHRPQRDRGALLAEPARDQGGDGHRG